MKRVSVLPLFLARLEWLWLDKASMPRVLLCPHLTEVLAAVLAISFMLAM